MTAFRTKEELSRAQEIEKFASVAEGRLYTSGESSPFPVHQYFRNKLLGKQVKMVEINAGASLVESMVADTITDMKIDFGDDATNAELEQEANEWLESIDYNGKLEEVARDYYGNGFGVQQAIRHDEGSKKVITMVNLDPSTWYPEYPTFTYQSVTAGKIVCVFDEGTGGVHEWYAFVEKHTVGGVEYQLYKIDNADSLDGTLTSITSIDRFKGLKDTKTDLDYLAVFQIDHQKKSYDIVGRSVLAPIWDLLQEVSEIQTQIRQERIKHLRAKIHAPMQSLQRAENVNSDEQNTQLNSKQMAKASGAYFDMLQDVFPVPVGATTVPGYIQRDLQGIVIGSQEIDKILSRAAGIVGCPKSAFNIEESAGNVKVDTEKRKDRRYTRRILQGQRRLATLAQKALETWYIWEKGSKVVPKIKVTFTSPFELSKQETADLMRSMNPDAKFVSLAEGVKQIWPEKSPDDQDALIEEIEEEQQAQVPPNSALDKIPAVTL